MNKMSSKFVITSLIGTVLFLSGASVVYMGFFSKFFGAKDVDSQQPSSEFPKIQYQEDWANYLTNVDGVIASIVVDLGIRKIAPVEDKPNVAWVSLKVNNPKPDGFPDASEMVELGKIEEALVLAVTSKLNAINVGHLNSDGRRDVYFYIGDTSSFKSTVSESMSAFPNHQVRFDWKEDENREGYFDFLYPRPRQIQSIENRKVISILEENGDKLTKERPVEHWINFKTETGREKFISKISGKKFEVVNKTYDETNPALPFGLQISRIDKVDHGSVDEYTIFLWETAGECEGDYDGWETMVEKD